MTEQVPHGAAPDEAAARQAHAAAQPAQPAAQPVDALNPQPVVGVGPDIRLTDADRRIFRAELGRAFHTQERIDPVLSDAGFDPAQLPPFAANARDTWGNILSELELGTFPRGMYRLLLVASNRYQANRTFCDLVERYPRPQPAPNGAQPQPPLAQPAQAPGRAQAPQQHAGPAPQPAAALPAACHLIVRAGSRADHQSALDALTGLGLQPQVGQATNHVVVYRLNTPDSNDALTRLDTFPLDFTLLGPSDPTYLLSALTVQGPDGRMFRFTDTPAAQTVADLAADTLEQYGADFGGQRTAVTDQVQGNGQGLRLDPDTTLHAAGIRDGDQMRVGFESTAGIVNPLFREQALARAANQIRAYAETHPGFVVWADASSTPTIYEFEFSRPSFAPPPTPGQEPAEIGPDELHRVQLDLGPPFPEEAPKAFWLTPIFHPNVYPNYECEPARRRPTAQGLVCFGDLADDGYRPGMDFGELCQALQDIAGFRNYGLFVPTADVDAASHQRLRANYFDQEAARWVMYNQQRIEGIGGKVLTRRPRRPRTFRNVVEDYVEPPDADALLDAVPLVGAPPNRQPWGLR